MSTEEDRFETFWREHPESKLELIDGRLSVPEGVHLSTVYDEISRRNPETCIADLQEYEHTTRSEKAEIAANAAEV